jgi:valacyclovir hydrolase
MAWFRQGDAEIYYEVAGEGSAVLLLPGFSDKIEGHLRLRDTLSRSYQVIAADLPGSGRSLPQPRRYDPGYLRRDAGLFIDMLRALKVTSPHLLGFSDGGEVALLIAALHPTLPRSVLTWGAAGFIDDPDGLIANSMRTVIDDPAPPMAGFRQYLIATYGEAVAAEMSRSFAGAVDGIVAAGGDVSRSIADRITCPLLMLAGETDIFAPKPLLDAYLDLVPTGEGLIFEGAGHGLHFEAPERFDATVAAWLARH